MTEEPQLSAVQILKSMTPEQRTELSAIVGMNIPEGDIEARSHGYVCSHCGELALLFIGEYGEEPIEEGGGPNVMGPCSLVAWEQPNRSARISGVTRDRPHCQDCGQMVALDATGPQSPPMFKPSRVVHVETWQKERDIATNARKNYLKRMRGNPEGTPEYRDERLPNKEQGVKELHASIEGSNGGRLTVGDMHMIVDEADEAFGFTDRVRGK